MAPSPASITSCWWVQSTKNRLGGERGVCQRKHHPQPCTGTSLHARAQDDPWCGRHNTTIPSLCWGMPGALAQSPSSERSGCFGLKAADSAQQAPVLCNGQTPLAVASSVHLFQIQPWAGTSQSTAGTGVCCLGSSSRSDLAVAGCRGAALALPGEPSSCQQDLPTFRWLKVRPPFPPSPPQSWLRSWSSRRRLSRRGPFSVSTAWSSFRTGR